MPLLQQSTISSIQEHASHILPWLSTTFLKKNCVTFVLTFCDFFWLWWLFLTWLLVTCMTFDDFDFYVWLFRISTMTSRSEAPLELLFPKQVRHLGRGGGLGIVFSTVVTSVPQSQIGPLHHRTLIPCFPRIFQQPTRNWLANVFARLNSLKSHRK